MNRKWLSRLVWVTILGVLLWWALRNAPLGQIWNDIRKLKLWQLGVLLIFNIVIYLLITLRWWIILRVEHSRIDYLPLALMRMAVFGVSYFTLGPQVGGEPLQVLYLQKRHGISFTRATASVIMDKLLEFLANFLLLALGVTAILHAGALSFKNTSLTPSLSGLVVLCLWPPVHILLLNRKHYPLSTFLKIFPKNKTTRFMAASEKLAGIFCQRHLSALVLAAFASILAGACMLFEFKLITLFLQIDLNIWQVIAAWTAGWLAFLIPLPGGLGALEASQVFALGMFGISPASAVSVAMLIRGRDILIGGIGLLFSAQLMIPERSVVNSSK